MDIASFVFATTPTNDVTIVKKFPGKLAHSFNKLLSRRPTSTENLSVLVGRITGVGGYL